MRTVRLTITRAGATTPEPTRCYDHTSIVDALCCVRRVLADVCRFGGGDVFDVELSGARWRAFGPRAGCGGRPELLRIDGRRVRWLSTSQIIATDARMTPPGRELRERYDDTRGHAAARQATTGAPS
jgi:hypothetical protein